MMMESQLIEYKEAWHDEYLKWICGFANAQGGTLYIGIDDNGKTIGVKDKKKLLEDLPNKIRDALGIIAEINIIQKDDVDVIMISIPPYSVPISCKGSYYIRSGTTNQKLSGLELEHFIMRKRGATWDNSPLPIFTEENVSESAIEAFKKRAVNKSRIDVSVLNEATHELLKKLHLNKDYSSGIPIQVSVYKDKLYIANCGHLPENLTVEKLMSKHSSEPFNPHIAHVFYLAGMIESWGRGIEKICEACRNEMSNQPVYTINNRDLMIKFSAKDSALSDDTKNIDPINENDRVNDRVIEIIRENPNTNVMKIADSINKSERQVRRIMAEMKKNGIIRRVGTDKNGHWEIIK